MVLQNWSSDPMAEMVDLELIGDELRCGRTTEDREYAACALGRRCDEASDAARYLAFALQSDHSSRVRRAAAIALGKLGSQAAVAMPQLVEALRDTSDWVRQAAMDAMGQIAQVSVAAIPALAEALLDQDEATRRRAAALLEKVEPPATAMATPAELLLDEGYTSQAAVNLALAAFGELELPMAGVPALMKALRGRELYVRRAAAGTLGKIDPLPAEAVPALAEALLDQEKTIRRAAADALGTLGSFAVVAVPDLVEALHDPALDVGQSAAAALGKIGIPAVPLLLKALQDRHSCVRRHAALAFAEMGYIAETVRLTWLAIDPLIEGVNGNVTSDPSSGYLKDAARALQNIVRDSNVRVHLGVVIDAIEDNQPRDCVGVIWEEAVQVIRACRARILKVQYGEPPQEWWTPS